MADSARVGAVRMIGADLVIDLSLRSMNEILDGVLTILTVAKRRHIMNNMSESLALVDKVNDALDFIANNVGSMNLSQATQEQFARAVVSHDLIKKLILEKTGGEDE